MFATATVAIVVTAVHKKSPKFFPQDCSAATQNILLAAHGRGLGTCWCGFYPKEEKMKAISDMFAIDETRTPFCVIAVGVPDEMPEAQGFFEKEKVRFFE